MSDTPTNVGTSVYEVRHEVRVALTDAPPLEDTLGRRRKPVALNVTYGVTQGTARADLIVCWEDQAERWPAVRRTPAWVRQIIDAYVPHDVDEPENDRPTGRGGHSVSETLLRARSAGEKATAPAATATPELLPAADAVDPLIVDRFDTAMEPAPEDPPVLIVGATAADGRPVALFFDAETRAKVAAWLAPTRSNSPREHRLAQLLDTIRTHGGPWTTRRVLAVRSRTGAAPQRGTARRDLAELHRRGHLTAHGPTDGRYYLLARKADRDA